MKTVIYHGDKKQRDEIRRKHMPKEIGPQFPIVITSYEVAMGDARKVLKNYNWKYVVVDEVSDLTIWSIFSLKHIFLIAWAFKEFFIFFSNYIFLLKGHRLKNSECKLFKQMKFVPMENKLLLTGTPLQNNLAELWSLLHFILPDIFSSLREFESWLVEFATRYFL